jgi:hypothetical protein
LLIWGATLSFVRCVTSELMTLLFTTSATCPHLDTPLDTSGVMSSSHNTRQIFRLQHGDEHLCSSGPSVKPAWSPLGVLVRVELVVDLSGHLPPHLFHQCFCHMIQSHSRTASISPLYSYHSFISLLVNAMSCPVLLCGCTECKYKSEAKQLVSQHNAV